MIVMPNLIERMEQVNVLCDELRSGIPFTPDSSSWVEARVSDIEGIVGEVLTMLDGR